MSHPEIFLFAVIVENFVKLFQNELNAFAKIILQQFLY